VTIAAWTRLRRRFDGLSLPVQIAIAGGAVSALAGAAAWRWLDSDRPWAPLAVAASALAATAGSARLARRSARALREVAGAARVLTRDDAPDDREIPLEEASAELQLATANLRRMVEAARRRQRALEARNLALSRQLEHRTHELTTLQDLSIGLATKSDLRELVDEALGALEQTMDYTSASLWARQGGSTERGQVVLLGYRVGQGSDDPGTEDMTGMRLSRANLQRYEQVERERKPLVENQARQSLLSWLWSRVTDDARSSKLYRASRAWMAVPLNTRERVVGVMRVDHHEPGYFDAQRVRLLSAVSSQAALAMHHAQLLAQERDVAVMAERNRIARDLHDAVMQTLFAANVMAGTLARAAERDPPPAAAAIREQASSLEKLNSAALAEMRLLMFELRPDALRRTPFAELLGHAAEALRCRGTFVVDSSLAREDMLSAETRIQLYRIAQEALSNVARHSGASRVEVQWQVQGPQEATLRIADNGRGFDAALPVPGHFGLENMRTRAQEIGAAFGLASAPGEGTELRVELKPAKHDDD
jgi:signal transduction histidine kinase